MTGGNFTDSKTVDAEFIRDLFQPFGAVTVRRMFGGAGLFADGVMFGLVSGEQIYLKADATTLTGLNTSAADRSNIQPSTARER
jgi:TfoX/Sxy family transcriptional regulator of competence genes